MATSELRFLNTLRISRAVNAITDPRLVPGNLRFLNRTRLVPSTDAEILARFFDQVLTADIIAVDQKAHVYPTERIKVEVNRVPKIKIGMSINEAMADILYAMNRGVNDPVSQQIFGNYQNNLLDKVVLGVRQRMNALCASMFIDSVVPAYGRLGIQLGGLSWGMWSDLNVVTGVAWSDPVNATPVNDVFGVVLRARARYARVYNRMEISTPAFRLMIATAEFQAKARQYLAPNVSFINLTQTDIPTQANLASNVFGMRIDLVDERYPQPNVDGSPPTYIPYLPLNQVLLSNTADDNTGISFDFANVMPAETMADAPGLIGGPFPAPAYGPVGFATLADPNLDPPGWIYWGVAKGFPRKFDQASTATLNVGAVVDAIPSTIQF